MLPSNAVRVREKYISRACHECQRRKRRCSGEKTCRNCHYWGVDCVFLEPRRSRQPRRANAQAQNSALTVWDTPDDEVYSRVSVSKSPARGESFENMSRNTHRLEKHHRSSQQELGRVPTRPQSDQQILTQNLSPNAPSHADNNSQTPLSTSGTDLSSRQESVFERTTDFVSGAALLHQIDVLNRFVSRSQGPDPIQVHGFVGTSTIEPSTSVGGSIYRDIDQIVEQVRSEELTNIHNSLDIFFANVQPYYPCMNESHLRAQFSAFLANDTSCLTKSCSIQLAALLSFILAAVNILCDTSAHCDQVPGWEEFCRGEELLDHSSSLEKANILTIQTLLMKTLYYMYASQVNSAYDTMGTTVRLCFQLGLHNETSWGRDCNFYDRTYRQRVFWSVFCLNHNVAQTRGVPELLRESDFNVGLPKCVDDRMLYPDCPPLREMPTTSPVTSLLEIIKLTRFSSEISETMFGVRAKRPTSQDFITTMDNKIVRLSREIQSSLRWPQNSGSQQISEGAPEFIHQQSFVLHLRLLHLRLLLRREEMISLAYGHKAARLCTDIATEVYETIEAFYTSKKANRCARHAYMHHLTGALVPVICIIIRQKNGEDLTQPAIDLFNKSLKFLENFAPTSFLARSMLRHLQRPIKAARDLIDFLQFPNVCSGAPANPVASSGAASNMVTSPIDSTQISTWNNASIGSDWELSLPNVYQDLFQDSLQRPTDIPFPFDVDDKDAWNDFDWS